MYFPRLRDLRNDAHLTQEQVGELLHTKQSVYWRYEKGRRLLPVDCLIILADLYHVSTDYILGRTDDPTPPKQK